MITKKRTKNSQKGILGPSDIDTQRHLDTQVEVPDNSANIRCP